MNERKLEQVPYRTPSPRATRMVPVLKYVTPASLDGYDVYWNGQNENAGYIGHIRKLGRRWQATLPNGNTFPVPFSSRRSAGERLRQTAEGRRVA